MAQREIKFRAWDVKSNNWRTTGIWHAKDNTFGISTRDNLVIEQFTGLHDKNGKEIYEGDILRWKSSNPFSLGEVRTVKVTYTRAWYWCVGSVNVYLDELLSNEKCEIIGNIHENADLLTP